MTDVTRDISTFSAAMENAAPNMKVPQERNVGLGSAIGFILSGFFFLLFFIGIAQVYGNIMGIFMIVFAIFGWDPIITASFMALISLFLAVSIYVISKRNNEAVSKIESGLNIMFKNQPTRFYDLGEVPTENIVRELVGKNNPRSPDNGRGCRLIAHDDKKGFDIRCDTIPVTRNLKMLEDGKIDEIETRQKLIIIGVLSIFGGLIAAATVIGVLVSFALYVLWIIFLVVFFYVTVELRVLKLWGVLIAWAIIDTFMTFTVPDIIFVWTMWGLLICATIAVAILYIVSKDACVKKKSWYCEFM